MKRIALFVFGALALSGSAWAQASADIDTPLLALPANLREGAGVVKWKQADHTYDTLKKSTNGLVCYDRSGFPLQVAFSMECTAEANLPRVKQNMEAEALGDKMKSEAKLMEQEKAGTRVKPVFGSVWYHLMGPTQGDGPHAHDDRGARRHDGDDGPAREWPAGRGLDHECGNDDRASHDAGRIVRCGRWS